MLFTYCMKTPNDPASQPISGFDMEKVITTLKQFVRDWSDEVTLIYIFIYLFIFCIIIFHHKIHVHFTTIIINSVCVCCLVTGKS